MSRPLLVVTSLTILAFAGCLGSHAGTTKEADGLNPSPISLMLRAHAVIADIDTGINPYHLDFRDETRTIHPSAYIPGFPEDARAINLTFDAPDYKTAFEADKDKWASIQKDELVWFPGTKIVGAIAVHAQADDLPVLDENSHGSGTSSVVLQSCPECSIVMIDFAGSGEAHHALNWISEQPWIDAVTMSWGASSNRGMEGDPSPALNAAIKKVWASGKLLVAAAGNTPYPYSWYLPAGSPYVIGVGGAEHSTHGETIVASKFPDMVSNYTNRVAHKDTFDSVGPGQGTSFASPAVAGVIGRMLIALRSEATMPADTEQSTALVRSGLPGPGLLADKEVTNSELWGALNASAEYFSTTDYSPQGYEPFSPTWVALGMTLPILPMPFVQMGWGYQGPETASRAVAQVLGHAVAADPMKASAEPYLMQRQAIEHRLWD